jgi:hypothetical protein
MYFRFTLLLAAITAAVSLSYAPEMDRKAAEYYAESGRKFDLAATGGDLRSHPILGPAHYPSEKSLTSSGKQRARGIFPDVGEVVERPENRGNYKEAERLAAAGDWCRWAGGGMRICGYVLIVLLTLRISLLLLARRWEAPEILELPPDEPAPPEAKP